MPASTQWRQGHLLTPESTKALGLARAGAGGGEVVAVVVSHDCDIHNDKEPFVEVIVGEILGRKDKQFEKARNPRQLHYSSPIAQPGADRHVALRHEYLVRVPVKDFFALAIRDDRYNIDQIEKRSLKQWLAARYGRPAFPDDFEAHLRKPYGKKQTVEKAIAEIVADEDGLLVGIFLDLGEYRTEDPPKGEPFGLRIYVVYDASTAPEKARAYGEAIAEKLAALFVEAYGQEDVATEIALERCTAIADLEFRLSDIRRTDQWRLEYVSLRQEPPGHFLGTDAALA